MSNFSMCRELDVDQEQCNELAQELLDKLVRKFGGSYKPEGSNFRYKHSAGVNALVEPRDGELQVDVKLGIMARALAPQIKHEMNKALDNHLEA